MKVGVVSITLLVCLLAGGLLRAQEATEEPVSEGFAFKWSAETVFPQGMQFFITVLRSADQLQSAILLIEPDGEAPVTATVDVRAPTLVGDTYTDLVYVWAFPPDMVLPLGSEITYEWRVVATDGEQARARDRAEFADTRVTWTRSADPLELIHLTVPSDVSAEALRAAVRPVYRLMAEQTGSSPQFDIIVYPADVPPDGCVPGPDGLQAVAPVSLAALPCEPGRAGAVFRASGQDAVQAQAGAGGAIAGVVPLLLQRFYEPLWEDSAIPGWFQAGLAEFYTPGVKGRYLGSLQRAARAGQLGPLGERATASDDGLWHAQSYAAVLYIADRVGLAGLFELARSAGAAGSFVDSFVEIVGLPLDGLWPALRRWLLTPQGERAFAYVPYLGDTPTPAASATSTPTRTPTITPTVTLTFTPSVTGVLTATPTATRPPTRTPTPGPPTVTPRPPGSLSTSTPTPAPLVTGLADSTTRNTVIVALAAALVVIAVIFLYSSRRR